MSTPAVVVERGPSAVSALKVPERAPARCPARRVDPIRTTPGVHRATAKPRGLKFLRLAGL